MLFGDLSLETIKEGLVKLKKENIEQDKAIRVKLKNFYDGNQVNHDYLYKYGFKCDDKEILLPFGATNITKKIIDKTSLLYKEQPKIRLDPVEKDDPYVQWIAENPDINIAKTTAERYKNLLHVILFAPLYFYRKWESSGDTHIIAEWRYFIETDFIPHFHEDDPLHPFGYSILIKSNPNNQDKNQEKPQRWMFWSDNYYFFHDNTGKSFAADETDFKNPFGVNPYIELRKNYPVDQYDSHGALDLVQTNQQINIAMADLNLMIHHQAFDQPYGTGISPEDAKDIEIGPHKLPIVSGEGDLKLLGYNPEIAATIEAIRFQIHTIAWVYNVSIDWSIEGTSASGVALKIKNIDLLEAREDDVKFAVAAEKKIYDVIQKQHTHYKSVKKLKDDITLPDKSSVLVNFEDIDFPLSEEERIKQDEHEFKWNISTPLDSIMAKDRDLDEKEAMVKYLKNKKINGQLTKAEIIQESALAAGANIIEEGTNEE